MAIRTAALVGATGLVGGHLLRLLLEDLDYSQVDVLTRRSVDVSSPKLVQTIADFDRPATFRAHLDKGDDVFCCLGTTIKKAGSPHAFRKVDFEYPLAVAQQALDAGARQYLIVSAVGASAKSGVLYNRVKGEVEEALIQLHFPEGVKIFHPSLLLGDRVESRPAERVAAVLMGATAPLFFGGLKRYRAIGAHVVARAMWKAAKSGETGVKVYEGPSLFELGGP